MNGSHRSTAVRRGAQAFGASPARASPKGRCHHSRRSGRRSRRTVRRCSSVRCDRRSAWEPGSARTAKVEPVLRLECGGEVNCRWLATHDEVPCRHECAPRQSTKPSRRCSVPMAAAGRMQRPLLFETRGPRPQGATRHRREPAAVQPQSGRRPTVGRCSPVEGPSTSTGPPNSERRASPYSTAICPIVKYHRHMASGALDATLSLA